MIVIDKGMKFFKAHAHTHVRFTLIKDSKYGLLYFYFYYQQISYYTKPNQKLHF